MDLVFASFTMPLFIFIPSLYFCKGSHFPLKMQ
nr:MAG TPA: hypothetical protein [Caudoviricetes sp.]